MYFRTAATFCFLLLCMIYGESIDYDKLTLKMSTRDSDPPPVLEPVINIVNVNENDTPPVLQSEVNNTESTGNNNDPQGAGAGDNTEPHGAGANDHEHSIINITPSEDNYQSVANFVHPRDDIRPQDSISNVPSNRSKSTTSSTLRLMNIKRQLELKYQLEVFQEQNKIEEEKLTLERIRKEEQLKLERIQKEEKMRLDRKQKEIALKAKLKAATDLVEIQSAGRCKSSAKSSVIPERSVTHNKHKENVDKPSAVTNTSNLPQPDHTPTNITMESVLNKLIDNQRDQALPLHEIKPFDGLDVMTYRTFIKNFELIVERNTEDSARRLEYLLKYTRGDAHEIIKNCPLIDPPSHAYKRAKALLERDFGNLPLLAAAFSSKAESWPKIASGDRVALRKFSIFLINCTNSKINNSDMNSMDGFEFLHILASKLPTALQQAWINKVGDIRDKEVRSPKLMDFENFVSHISRNENDPRITGLGYQQKSYQNKQNSMNPSHSKRAYASGLHPVNSSSNSTSREPINRASIHPCLYCGNNTNHSILVCRKFGSLSPHQKSDVVKKSGLCFSCLNPGHMKPNCPNPQWSKCMNCSRSHPTIMHDPTRDSFQSNNRSDVCDKAENKPKITSGCAEIIGNEPLMAVIPVKIKTTLNSYPITTLAFVDNGCSAVFISKVLSDALRVRTKTTKVLLKTLNLEQWTDTEMVLDNLIIGGVNNNDYIELPQSYVRTSMPVNKSDAPSQQDINKYKHLRHVQVSELSGEFCIPEVTLMIGSNMPAATMPLEVAIGDIGEPYAIKSPLGWLLYGLPGKLSNVNSFSVNFCQLDSRLEKQVKSYFDLEFAERLNDDQVNYSIEDKQFIDIMDKSAKLVDGHYELELPLRNKNVNVPNNKLQAEMYAEKLKKKLLVNDKLHCEYTKFMNDLESKNYCEHVPIYDINGLDKRLWYIPHHSVKHPKKPDKVRIVFNCPIVYDNFSLNNHLLQGPDLTNRLLSVLIRWRQELFAVMADIESMFYQVRVAKSDCDMLRYLWWPKGDLTKPLCEYRMLVHVFGATSSPACANYALKKVALDNQNDYNPFVIDSILNDFYVDDFLKSVSDEIIGISLIRDVCELLSKGGFRLTKWISNSRKLLNCIPEQDRIEEVRDLDLCNDLPVKRALGVQWCVESDMIEFKVEILSSLATRRNILSVMSSIFDPFGIASPFILKAKIILQNLCRAKLTWDEPIPSEWNIKWCEWLSQLSNLEQLRIQRCLKPYNFGNIVNTQLHHFADASQDGYGTVTYIRFLNDSGSVHTAFVLARSRVAPLKPHTIVKLELSAATSLVRINTMLNREFSIPIDREIFWTDSQTVLKYVNNNTSRYPVFVSNRIAVIRDGSNVSDWRYVPSKMNPADYCSRGLGATELSSKRWLEAPEFLHNPETEWPENYNVNNETCDNEIKVNSVKCENDCVTQLFQKYSDWVKLKRCVSWWMRLKAILKLKAKKQSIPDDLCKHSLSHEEIVNSESVILRYVQNSCYSKEIDVLKNDSSEKCVTSNSDISSLDPILKDNLLRVGGRLRNSNIPYNAKHQIILPKNCHISWLIVKHIHKVVGHQGMNHTVSELRQKFWIIKAGLLVKNFIRNCVTCRKSNSRVCEQKMADIPVSRLIPDEKPFSRVGIDYFGPFCVKVGRSVRKKYGVIFTCLASRAIHIEVADTLDTDSCVSAIRRFIARRGYPVEIFSDNGTNLIAANKELKSSLQQLDQNVLNHFSARYSFKWNFNPPAASHFGGIWERQIRTIRKILQAILCDQYLKTCQSEEQLRTFMCEVEAIINSRPLTKTSDNPNDLDVITPNSILLYDNNVLFPIGTFSDRDLYAKRRWRQVQYLSDLFWKRWTKEYLPSLQKRQKWLKPLKNIAIGDIVLVVDSMSPRASWTMGKVVETYPNKLGLVRSVKLKTETGFLVRPIDKLCLLLEQEN